MAEYVAIQPYIKFPVYGNCVTELCFVPKGLWSQNQRKYQTGYGRVTRNFFKPGGLQFKNLKLNKHHERHMTRHCLGTLINAETNSSGWIPVIDQVLLMASFLLTHMAKGLPVNKSFPMFGKETFSDIAPKETIFSGSDALNEKDSEANLNLSWDTVKGKLIDSINAIESGTKLDDGNMVSEQIGKQPSCLGAVAEGPRFRLLLASFKWLKNEVDNISRSSTYSPDVKIWQKVFFESLESSSLSICTDWLKDELSLKDRRSIKELPSSLVEKLGRYDSVSQNIKKSGKEELYTELLYLLKFGTLSPECCYDSNLFGSHGVAVLEDLVITLAEGIASIYLELISVDSDISNEMNNLGLTLCTLSTRSLQRLRNEVALNQWLYQNMEVIVSMYEDRLDLRVFQTRPVLEPSKGKTVNFDWLKKSGPTVSPFQAAVISCVSVQVKRTKELRALTGWRYYCSLFLESADIMLPFIRTLFTKIRDAVSFFLVFLIGRSLGLIYTGIRQSLRWK